MQNYVTFAEEKSLKKFAKDRNYQKIRDHRHYTGKYRDTAHSFCNLKFHVPNDISVVFQIMIIILSLKN